MKYYLLRDIYDTDVCCIVRCPKEMTLEGLQHTIDEARDTYHSAFEGACACEFDYISMVLSNNGCELIDIEGVVTY